MSDEWAQNVVVVTGTSGSGKTTVCELLAKRGAHVIDADKLARTAVEPGSDGLAAVVQEFGTAVLQADGTLDRRGLGEIIFQDPEKRRTLERLTHPIIGRLAISEAANALSAGAELIVYDCPLFFETGLDRLAFAAVIVVVADSDRSLDRIIQRDEISGADAQRRIATQMEAKEKELRGDFVIYNNGTLSELEQAVDEIYEQLPKH